jgi:hypothetical protein
MQAIKPVNGLSGTKISIPVNENPKILYFLKECAG